MCVLPECQILLLAAASVLWQGLDAKVHVLFLSSGDSVYLDREDLREEYVLNDSGLIWMGTAAKNCGMPWNFGQASVASQTA